MPNTILKEVATKQIFPNIKDLVSTAISFSQGDHLIFDASTHLVRAPTAETEASTYLGIAALNIVSGVPVGPYAGLTAVNAAQAIPAMNGPTYGDVVKFTLFTGDSINPGDQVFVKIVAGNNQVVSITGTKAIGIYQGAAIASAAAGTQIAVLTGARYSNDTLKF